MASSTLTLTDFLRKPKKVLARVDKEDVVLHRRAGKAAIRLSVESKAASAREGVELAARLLASAVRDVPQVPERLPAMLNAEFPWIRFLPEEGRNAFARELVETLEACASIGNTSRLAEVVHAWKATAEIYSDPALLSRLKPPLPAPSGAAVPRPSVRRTRE